MQLRGVATMGSCKCKCKCKCKCSWGMWLGYVAGVCGWGMWLGCVAGVCGWGVWRGGGLQRTTLETYHDVRALLIVSTAVLVQLEQ